MPLASFSTMPRFGRSREHLVMMGGLATVGAALLLTFAVLPFARHWQAREARLDAARNRVAYLESLGGRTDQLTQSAAEAEARLMQQTQRVVRARSEPLAASMLQTLMQDAADTNNLLVTRIEITNQGNTSGTGTPPSPFAVPATIAAYGDIVGVTGFLSWLAHGPRVLQVDRVVLQRNSALLGAADVVQLSVDVRAPVLPRNSEASVVDPAASPVTMPSDSLAIGVVRGNIFSATRRGPTTRFLAPGRSLGETMSNDMRAPVDGGIGVTAGDASESPVPVLSGIVVRDGERQALLQLTAIDDVPRLYREGDTRSGFRIVRIGVDHVVISSRGRSRTYRLVSPPASPASPPASPAVPSPPAYQ